MLRCHTPALVERVRTAPRLARPRHDLHRDDLRGGAARRRRGDRGGAARRLRARAAAGPPRASRGGRWASASSTRSRSPPAGRRPSSALERVAILDWDVHHGNGTQDIVGDDPTILFVSLHQWPFYPGTGGPGRAGRDAAQHPARRGHRRRRLPRRVRAGRGARSPRSSPSCCSSRPGFDAHADDPLAELELSTDAFRELAAPRVGARPARRRGARGRLQPGHAPDPRRGRAGGLSRRPGSALASRAASPSFSSAWRRDKTSSFARTFLHVGAHRVVGDGKALRDLLGAVALLQQEQLPRQLRRADRSR